jgi:hypothetical protein
VEWFRFLFGLTWEAKNLSARSCHDDGRGDFSTPDNAEEPIASEFFGNGEARRGLGSSWSNQKILPLKIDKHRFKSAMLEKSDPLTVTAT